MNNWHDKTLKSVKKLFDKPKYNVYCSHLGEGNIPVYFKDTNAKDISGTGRKLANVDILATDKNNEQPKFIVEIQKEGRTTPKDIVGIIGAINLAEVCCFKDKNSPLKNINLIVIVEEPKTKSKKDQLDLIQTKLKFRDGCIKKFTIIVKDKNFGEKFLKFIK